MPKPNPLGSSSPDSGPPDPAPVELTDELLTARIQSMKAFLARYPSRRDGPSTETKSTIREATDEVSARSAGEDPPHESTPLVHVERSDSPTSSGDTREISLGSVLAEEPQEDRATSLSHPFWRYRWWAVAAAAAIAAMFLLAAAPFRGAATIGATGTLVVETSPAGAFVRIDGGQLRKTPVRLDLPAGSHELEVMYGAELRRVPVSITAGSLVSHSLELPNAVPALGALEVRTDPVGASVAVDGRPVGRSPLTLSDLVPGAHTVTLRLDVASLTERVRVETGKTTALVVPMAAGVAKPSGPVGPAAGWITVSTPADVQIFEDGRLLGSSRVERLMLPVGRHEIELVNESLAYRERQSVDVSGGATAVVTPKWPTGNAAFNAAPWADVFVDGTRAGETPIGRLALPIGTHEIVFRHPDLGERRSSVTIRAGQSTRVAVDLRAP